MWLVTGIDEEHRFRDWAEAAAFYRQIVEEWVAAHVAAGGPPAATVGDLPPGASHEVEFPAGAAGGQVVRFRLAWEIHDGRMDHFVAC